MIRFTSALTVLTVLGAAGCASADPGVDPRAAEFVAEMLPHHLLGVELVEEATVRSDDVRLRRLVFEMGGYHDHEVHLLTEWAEEWGLEPAQSFEGDLAPHDVAKLGDLSGLDHDTWWLTLMIEHHRGAISIAERTLAVDGAVADLAANVLSVQGREIDQMVTLREELCASELDAAGCAGRVTSPISG